MKIGQWMARSAVVALAALASGVTADHLLRIAAVPAELVLDGTELAEFDDEPPEEKEEQAPREQEHESADLGREEPSDDPPSDAPPEPPPAAIAVAERPPSGIPESSPAPSVPPPLAPGRRESASTSSAPESSSISASRASEGGAAASAGTDGSRTGELPRFSTSDAGQLSTFDGVGEDGAGADEGSGQGLEPVWEVTFRGQVLGDHAPVRGTLLVAVRRHGMQVEIIPLTRQRVEPSRPLDSFLRAHPQFGRRQGILLPSRYQRPWADQLLNYGGGWETWLLVEDAVVRQWLMQLERRLEIERRSWGELQRVTAEFAVRDEARERVGDLRIRNLQWKEQTP